MANAKNPEPYPFTVKVIRLGNGWYSFKKVEQHSYIKVDGLHCGTDRKAANMARRVTDDNMAKVIFI